MIKYLYFNISILNLIILLIYELKIKLNNIENIQKNIIFNIFMNFNGDWGLGIGDWGLGIGPNPQSPIPNPQSPIPNPQFDYFFNIKIINN